MLEDTLRNKSREPIVTFKPKVMTALLAARPESSSLTLAKLKRDYQALSGKVLRIDHVQQAQLLTRYGASSLGQWTSEFLALPATLYYVKQFFTDGFLSRTMSTGVLTDLAIAEAFFEMLGHHVQATQALPEKEKPLQ